LQRNGARHAEACIHDRARPPSGGGRHRATDRAGTGLHRRRSGEQRATLALIEDKVRAALDLKYAARAKQRRAEEGKDTGTVRFEDNGFVVIAELPKRVKWDQDKLRHAGEVIRTGWGDDPADYIKTKLEVSETAYANWPRPVRELFTPARTVETGRPVYRIKTPHEANSEPAGAA
jgi:hypothetical protein